MKPNETIGVRKCYRDQVAPRIKERDGYVRHWISHLVSDNARDHLVLFEHVLAHDGLGVRQRTSADGERVRGVIRDHHLTSTRTGSIIATPSKRGTLQAITQMDRQVDHSRGWNTARDGYCHG